MQTWRLDIVTLASAAFVVALSAILPTQLAASLIAGEVAFGLFTAQRHHYFEKRDDEDTGNSDQWLQDGLHSIQRLLDPSEGHSELVRQSSWFLGWWLGASHRDLSQHNVADFIAYTFFGRRAGSFTADYHKVLLGLSDIFVSTIGLNIKDNSYNKDASFIAHTEQPLKVHYRPAFFYALTETVAGWNHLQLTLVQKFKMVRNTQTAAYYVQNRGEKGLAPIVILHGIGLGLAPYSAFIKRIQEEHPRRTIIAVQYKHVSMRLTSHIPTATEVADDVAVFLREQGYYDANIIAHSYGTFVASSFAKRHSSMVAGLTLIDPVCFAMFLPHLVSNTLHFDLMKKPVETKTKLMSKISIRGLLKGLVLRELHCAAAMSRRFKWTDLNLWISEVPANTTIVLGGGDNMIPVESIKQLLTSDAAISKGIRLVFNEDQGHGGFLMDAQLQDRIAKYDSVSRVHTSALQEMTVKASTIIENVKLPNKVHFPVMADSEPDHFRLADTLQPKHFWGNLKAKTRLATVSVSSAAKRIPSRGMKPRM